MSEEIYIGGNYTEYVGGNKRVFAGGDIITYSEKEIIQTAKKGIIYGKPEKAPPINKHKLLKMFMIHFRRSSTYNGEFGFDWLRDEYIYPITEVNNVKKELCLNIQKLKTEYKSIDVSNPIFPFTIDYYCSFINLMLNQEVVLDIELEELEILSPDSTEIIFESSNPNLIISPSNIPLKTLITNKKLNKNLGGTSNKNYYLATDIVKIKCNNILVKNEEIKVFAKILNPTTTLEEKEEVGKMVIMRNDQIYKLKARFVEVKFKGKLIFKNNELGIENILNFSDEISIASMPSANISNSQTLKLSKTITNWKSYIENNEIDFRNKFNQAFIKYEPFKDIKNKIDYKSLKIDFKNFTINSSSEGNGINRIKKSITSIDIDALACNMEEFLTGLHEIYAMENTPESGITVFLLPIIIRYSNPPEGVKMDYLDGFSDDVFSTGRYIMMTNYNSLLRKETLIHEAAHTLGLFHSFQTNTIDNDRPVIPDYTFEYATTENIMDYSSHVVTFWKWQWKKMKEDTTDLELIQ